MPEAPNPFTGRVRRLARLRQALAVALLVAAAAVLAVYLLHRRDAGRAAARAGLQAPLLGLKIQQSASGVTIAQDAAGRPVFRVFAQRVDKLRVGGHEVLHQVRILVYDKDGVHSDQISGDEFSFDDATYQLSAQGPVHIDLQVPTPIHLEASDLTYNVKARTGAIARGLTFSYLNAQGSAAAAQLDGASDRLDLSGGVRLTWHRSGLPDWVMASDVATVQRLAPAGADAAVVTLERHARLDSGTQSLVAERLVFHLRANQTLRELDAAGGLVAADSAPARPLRMQSEQGRAEFVATGAYQTAVSGLQLSGGVAIVESGPRQRQQLTAGRVDFLFAPDHQLDRVQARDGARLSLASPPQQSLAAPELDFLFAAAAADAPRHAAQPALSAVLSQGRAQVEVAAAGGGGPAQAAADHLRLDLDAAQRPLEAVASGDVRLRQTIAGALRTSRSDQLQLHFSTPAAGPTVGPAQLAEAVESGHVALSQGERQLQADQVDYNAARRETVLTAEPGSAFSHGQVRGTDPQTSFSAPTVTWVAQVNGGGELTARGGVSLSRAASAVFGAAAPLVVTASSLSWQQPPGHASGAVPAPLPADAESWSGTGDFSGHVRLLQSPNLLRADHLRLDGAAGVATAEGHVQTSFVQTAGRTVLPAAAKAPSGPTPVTITADSLRYQRATRQAVYQGRVTMRTATATLVAPRLVVLMAAPTSAGRQAGSLERAVASGGVRITQPGRTAVATQVSYDAIHNLVTLAGGPPSIFDAEHGKITGDPLTFSLSSDEIQVDSNGGVRASGQTIVHR